MSDSPTTPGPDASASFEDPRASLAAWANANDEWVRLLVGEVLVSGRALGAEVVERAYELFRQEKALDERSLPTVAALAVEARQDEMAPPLTLTRLSGVRGINALAPGAEIEPHEGLTILYGENGTGKTGYSRIFKALANSRTADEILGNIESGGDEEQTATIEYTLAGEGHVLSWTGAPGVPPFTRMSIFDSPSVATHVDGDLDYVYVPAALALFNHVIAALQAMSSRIDEAVDDLKAATLPLLGRFPRESSVYPLIETLGASTDIEVLRAKASADPEIDEKLDALTQAVAALKANTLGTQLTARKRDRRVLEQAGLAGTTLLSFDAFGYSEMLAMRARLEADLSTFRRELFTAADLPAAPDETWSRFIEAGEGYRQHLVNVAAHDAERCLYCRQPLADQAHDLLVRYASYLEDKITHDIRDVDNALDNVRDSVAALQSAELKSFIREFSGRDDKPPFFESIVAIEPMREAVVGATRGRRGFDGDIAKRVGGPLAAVEAETAAAARDIAAIEEQARNRLDALTAKEADLAELQGAAELARSWTQIEQRVDSAKEADRLQLLRRPFSQLSRSVTELSKAASDQLINQSFDALFDEECEALRAPPLKLQFVGREGRAHRRKVLSGRHRPSKVLSEGEQKVLALADFLAEARLAGITAPVVFDDPVSSLDHRRINEVAARVAKLADENQVIVFTHDIFFATTLLALFERSKRCSYFQITDEGGKGRVSRATGPRWDTLGGIRGKINSTIEAAKGQSGEARDALVRTGYDWIRAWCEVFTESELLRGVTQRYQPNVGMTRLTQINTEELAEIIPKVTEIFEIACRYIDGHSQPLPTLGVTPTLAGLEAHWLELQELRAQNKP